MSFLTGQKRTATVRAVDGATVVEISAANLQPIVQARPAILRELTALMKKRQAPGEEDSFGVLLERISSAILAEAGL
jgi:CRP-like cAMP-binding protein